MVDNITLAECNLLPKGIGSKSNSVVTNLLEELVKEREAKEKVEAENDALKAENAKLTAALLAEQNASVDWEDEKICFQTIAAALGNFYAMHPPLLPNPSGDGLKFYRKRVLSSGSEGTSIENIENGTMEAEFEEELLLEAENAWAQREWSIQHVLFPSLRLFFKPPTSMATNGTFVQVASLEMLYRIFERC
ncbi:DNA mismatch repair protein [Datura stramonium]|uniref:DNA mismatch repair protein n=1 Tax=Datura stramonium TaxID=4076 RepID=A0ABS8VE99_DATST|nr:DNA mismatch repair protein [Datura stramonium]